MSAQMAPTKFGDCDIPWIDTRPPEDTTNHYPYVKQTRRTDILPQGWQKSQKQRALDCDTIYDQHIPVTMRDGVQIYLDILRPVINTKIPAILAVSPYGKGGHGFMFYEGLPYRLGVKIGDTSGLEKFEGPDIAEWGPRGYAIVNIDIRGSWESEGNVYIEGTFPGYDVYDISEYIASLDWCNGATTMLGNSWLATEQWSAALVAPPSLKCLAPWEGFCDKYRDVAARGGVPRHDFMHFVFNETIRGRGKREDLGQALRQWPLFNEYWADKALDTSNVDIPTYALASYSSNIHGNGTIRAFNRLKTREKWLRIHPVHEWFDQYSKEAVDDVQRFFDHYLKGIDNGWETTPPVRVSLLTYGSRGGAEPIVNLPFTEYPPKEVNHSTFYLTSWKALASTPETTASQASYQSDDYDATPLDFVHTFDRPTRLIGFSKAKLWVSTTDNDDMDIYTSIRKVDRRGNLLEHVNLPWSELPNDLNTFHDILNVSTIKYKGPTGILRISHREVDPKRSVGLIPYHPHTTAEKVPPGTIIPVEIGIELGGIHFEAGEGMVLRIQGHLDQYHDLIPDQSGKPANLNQGTHIIHVGGDYDSHLVVPTLSV